MLRLTATTSEVAKCKYFRCALKQPLEVPYTVMPLADIVQASQSRNDTISLEDASGS